MFQRHLAAMVRQGCDPWAFLPDPQFIYLVRHDLIGQSISLVRARQTRQYSGSHKAVSEPRYSVRFIKWAMRHIGRENARWERYFASNGIVPLRLVYEDLVADHVAALTRIADLAGVSLSAVPQALEESGSLRQQDSLSAQWRGRFIREEGDPCRIW